MKMESTKFLFAELKYDTRCLIVNLLPKPYEESEIKALFSNFLIYFTFTRRTKKITFFFVFRYVNVY